MTHPSSQARYTILSLVGPAIRRQKSLCHRVSGQEHQLPRCSRSPSWSGGVLLLGAEGCRPFCASDFVKSLGGLQNKKFGGATNFYARPAAI